MLDVGPIAEKPANAERSPYFHRRATWPWTSTPSEWKGGATRRSEDGGERAPASRRATPAPSPA
eukprot:5933172-Pyramimonas_sp.AAC.1